MPPRPSQPTIRQLLRMMTPLVVGAVMGVFTVLVVDAHAPEPKMVARSANSSTVGYPYLQGNSDRLALRVLPSGHQRRQARAGQR